VASITIRRLDDAVKAKLQKRAASHGRSMEEEAREILNNALTRKPGPRLNLAHSIRRHLAETGGVVLELPPREPVRDPPAFTK
jgi:plasmid stability protein